MNINNKDIVLFELNELSEFLFYCMTFLEKTPPIYYIITFISLLQLIYRM